MTRTSEATAKILSDLYEETFSRESYEPFRITWPQLRSIAGVAKLSEAIIKEINAALADTDYCLLALNECLLFTKESDLDRYRLVSDRMVEERLPDADNEIDDDDDFDDDDD